MSGVHWQMMDNAEHPRTAEIAAGLLQTSLGSLKDQATAFEKQITDTIRERPLTSVAGAIGVGFLIALLSRR